MIFARNSIIFERERTFICKECFVPSEGKIQVPRCDFRLVGCHFLIVRTFRPKFECACLARRAGAGLAGALQHYAQSSLFDLPLYILQEVDVTFPLLAYCIITNAYTLLRKMSETSVKIIKNEEGCRDDTVPKTVETRRHCEVD